LCVGQQFALAEMGYTIVRILQRFERIENRMTEPPKMKADIVLQPAHGVQVAFF
jgi:cytochrome P450